MSKTHLDLGFTALAAEVADQYVDDFFPRAIAVARELRSRGGPERLVWTTGAWPLWLALERTSGAARRDMEQAVVAGDLAWHALPLTTHTELMDVALFEAGLGISAELDERFGHRTIAAKMTDVPGHTRGVVPLLAAAGVRLLHLGVNPAWPVPDVPPVFRWRAPDGSEVVVIYQAGGYGGFRSIDGCADALAFAHTGDNLGPPSVDAVLASHRELRDHLPGVEVAASTLDAFAAALVDSGAIDALPVVTAEIGDPWLFGAGSDPQKLARYRDLLRTAAAADRAGPAGASLANEARRQLLLVAEHTWGLDQKEAVPDVTRWDRAGLAELRTEPATIRFEQSWAEQRAYLDRAEQILSRAPKPRGKDERESWAIASGLPAGGGRPGGARAVEAEDGRPANGVPAGARAVEIGEVIDSADWSLSFDAQGAVAHLVSNRHDRVVADVEHPVARLGYQTFDEADYARFFAGLTPTDEDQWWARLDNTKPGIDAAGALSRWWEPRMVEAWYEPPEPGRDGHRLAIRTAFPPEASLRFGAAPEWWTVLSWSDAVPGPAGRFGAGPSDFPAAISIEVSWFDKPACRLPEASWCSFMPVVDDPNSWTLNKLGQPVSPLDVVRHGGRGLHAVEAMYYGGAGGSLYIPTLDAALVAPGQPRLLDADPPLPDLAGGMHVLLHDNLWGTNFPMWNEGGARFRFGIELVVPPTIPLARAST